MDLHLASAGPFTYLVGEHARAIVAIQELQREVNSLLSFRDHVLEALPHLQLREPPGAATPRPRSHTQTPGGKSLSEGPPTVADSGFSTDKASTSMGKSSSSSSGELSGGGGGGRWALGEPPDAAVAPLGSVEDELWTLLEVIERKGSRLRKDLERAEERERELGHASDPAPRHSSQDDITASPTRQSERWRGPGGDWWPHSLPGAGPRLDFVPGLEAWGEVERLRVDRLYLMGRLQRAEAEGGAAHQRLLDLHAQLLSLAGEKRRLEDAFRVLRGTEIPSQMAASKGSNKGVTVSVGGDAVPTSRRSSSVRIGDDVFLPRVLKVPIKDKWSSRPPSRIPQGIAGVTTGTPAKGDPPQSPSPSKTIVLFPSSKTPASEILSPPSGPTASSSSGDRVVIERERSANRVDGGLSMPASLLKGARVKVRPDKQRISAILREKDVLALQKQLLTTVMETEVLRRQLEMAGEEWEAKIADWENDRKRQQDVNTNLKSENTTLKKQLEQIRSIKKVDVAVYASPSTHNASVGTADEAEIPTFSVHHGPNVKYDVVVYEESSSETPKPSKGPSVAPRKPPTVEKPPRRARPLSVGPAGESPSFGRDSLGKIAKVPLRPSSRTPPATPRSSPAPSMSVPRNPGGRVGSIPEGGAGGTRSSLVNGSLRNGFGRRDSLRGAAGSSGTPPGGKGAPSGGTHKNIPVWHHNVNGNIRRHSQEKFLRSQVSRSRDGQKDSCSDSKSSPQSDDRSHDSNDFFDSISDCLPSPQYIGYQKGIYTPHIPYLSPSSPLWLPFYTQTLPLPKGRIPGGNAYLNQRWRCAQEEESSPPSDSLELEYPHFEARERETRESSTPMENAVCLGFRRKLPSGILRVKKTSQRPSVLP